MKIQTYQKAEAYLETLIPTTYKSSKALRLERIKLLLGALGNPEKKLKFVHIGGTAGKGSTATILSQLLQGQGLKVGLHISPHLQSARERLQINGENISEENFVKIINELFPHIEEISKTKYDSPTYFETLVAAAFLYFYQEKVDIAVVEVGLGGSLDATNVITPLVSILTNVGLDHTEILGDTVEKIAVDKVGIFKKNVPVITGVKQESVKEIVYNQAAATNSELILLNRDFSFEIEESSLEKTLFEFKIRDKVSKFDLGTAGLFQVENASLALAALNKLEEIDFINLDKTKLSSTLKKVAVPGRFEIVAKDPLTILDGAHNPMKMTELTKSLEVIGKRFVFLLSFKKGKNIAEMLEILKPLAEIIVVTEFSANTDMGTNLATTVSEVDLLIQKDKPLLLPQPRQAFGKATELAKERSLPLVVTGSLYLVGEIRNVLIDKTNKLP